MRVSVGLLHYPILDRQGKIVATNITNFDVHDIARASRVYGIENYYIIHPMQEQLMFVSRLLDHWRSGEGSRLNPMRKTALTMVQTATSLDEALKHWGVGDVRVVATHAKDVVSKAPISFRDLRAEMHSSADTTGYLLLFGTGFGMTADLMQSCHHLLEPITGRPPMDYRHLSVRSAVSICLDRLLGSW